MVTTTTLPLLTVNNLTVRYGGVVAVDDVSFSVGEGALVGLIGPNGAGKTSLIDALTGYTPTAGGEVIFDGAAIGRMRAYRRARLGLARTFQSVELFHDLTVEENLLVASERVGISAALRDIFLPARNSDRSAVEWAIAACDLESIVDRKPAEISHGQRKLVGVARSLSQQPKMLLLDEPAAGLNTDESEELGGRLRQLVDRHQLTILLIDHDMNLVMNISDEIHVLDFGSLIAHGTPSEIRENPRVVEAYLGSQVSSHDQ